MTDYTELVKALRSDAGNQYTSDAAAAIEALQAELSSVIADAGARIGKAEAEVKRLEPKQGEIVRCKECKHYNAGFECLVEGYGIERDPDWFCADGERKVQE